MAKYMNYNEVTKTIGESNMALLLEQGTVKKGSPCTLQLMKEGKWVSAPLANSEKVMAYLSKMLPKPTIEVETAPQGGEINKSISIKEIANGVNRDTIIKELGESLSKRIRFRLANDTSKGSSPYSIWGFAEMTTKYYGTEIIGAINMTWVLLKLIEDKVESTSPRGQKFLSNIKNDVLRERVKATIDLYSPITK